LSVRSTTDRIRDIAPIDLPVGRASPQKSGKNRNCQKLSRVWPALGKVFQEFSPRAGICCRGAYCLVIEENRAGLHSTVSPPDGAQRGPIEQFAPPPCPNLGADPNFKILFSGAPRPLQTPKISRENLDPFLKKNFLHWRKFNFFLS